MCHRTSGCGSLDNVEHPGQLSAYSGDWLCDSECMERMNLELEFQLLVLELKGALSEMFRHPDEHVVGVVTEILRFIYHVTSVSRDMVGAPFDTKDVISLWEQSNLLWPTHQEQARRLQRVLRECSGKLCTDSPRVIAAGVQQTEEQWISVVGNKYVVSCVSSLPQN